MVTAIFATDSLDYGLSRVFEDYRGNSGLTVKTFREKDEAEALPVNKRLTSLQAFFASRLNG